MSKDTYIVSVVSVLVALAIGLAMCIPTVYEWLRDHVPPGTPIGASVEATLLACLQLVGVWAFWVFLLFVLGFVRI